MVLPLMSGFRLARTNALRLRRKLGDAGRCSRSFGLSAPLHRRLVESEKPTASPRRPPETLLRELLASVIFNRSPREQSDSVTPALTPAWLAAAENPAFHLDYAGFLYYGGIALRLSSRRRGSRGRRHRVSATPRRAPIRPARCRLATAWECRLSRSRRATCARRAPCGPTSLRACCRSARCRPRETAPAGR